MAATISDLANGTSVAVDTVCVTGATVTASVGDWLVVIAASSNDATLGASSQTGVVDSDGINTYTQRCLANRNPGTFGNGATLGIYTCEVTSALSSDTITVNHSTNTTEKAVQVYKVAPGTGEAISFIATDSDGTTGNTATHTGASAISVTSGDIIFGGAAIETDDTITGDSDTVNGSWSSVITRLADAGADAACMSSSSQYKTVNATGNQTWAVTTGSARQSARSYLIIRSAISNSDLTLSKTLGALTSSAAYTVDTNDAALTKTLGALTVSAAYTVDTNNAVLSQTLGTLTASSTFTALGSSDLVLAQTLGALTASAAYSLDTNSAVMAQEFDRLTVVSGAAVIAGPELTLSKTLGALASSSFAVTLDTNSAVLSQTLGALTCVAVSAKDAELSLNVTLGALTSSSGFFKWDTPSSDQETWTPQSGSGSTWTQQSPTDITWTGA